MELLKRFRQGDPEARMNHPYVRAYMAGIVVPTAFLLVAMTAFTLARFVFEVPVPLERVVVFPMALIFFLLFGVMRLIRFDMVALLARHDGDHVRQVDSRELQTAVILDDLTKCSSSPPIEHPLSEPVTPVKVGV